MVVVGGAGVIRRRSARLSTDSRGKKKETIDQRYGSNSNSNSNQRALEAESQTGYQCNSQCECCECEEGGREIAGGVGLLAERG